MDTRERLLDATASLLAGSGLAGVSARSIAAESEINQALVFYHFGSVSGLLDAAVRRSVDAAVETYRDRLAAVTSLAELLEVARDLHTTERRAGNVQQMAQVMAGAMRDDALAGAGRYAMDRWSTELESVLARVLRRSPLDGLVEPRGLARAVAAGFVGLELYDGVDEEAAASALAALESVGAVVSAFEGLPPVALRAARSRARKAVAKAAAARGESR